MNNYSPFLKLNLGGVCPRLCGNEFLEIAYGIVWAAFNADCEGRG
jgi:hypothetical protein